MFKLNMIHGILDEVDLVSKIVSQVETTLLGVVADHDVVVKDDEPVGVEVEEAVEEERIDIRQYRYTSHISHQDPRHDDRDESEEYY